MKTKKRHYMNFYIAGFSYWDGCIVLNELKIGTELTLNREEDNKFDPYAVAIYYGKQLYRRFNSCAVALFQKNWVLCLRHYA